VVRRRRLRVIRRLFDGRITRRRAGTLLIAVGFNIILDCLLSLLDEFRFFVVVRMRIR
jgi:hypothetical protein